MTPHARDAEATSGLVGTSSAPPPPINKKFPTPKFCFTIFAPNAITLDETAAAEARGWCVPILIIIKTTSRHF